MNKVSLSLQEKQLTVFVANGKIQTSQQKLEFWKTWICYCVLDIFLMLKDFPGEISEDINKCDSLILYNEMYQHLEDLYNSEPYFLNDQCIISQNG